MIDKRAIREDLTREFINYQHRLDCPMPIEDELQVATRKYLDDPIFHAKVKTLVCGVMQILEKHI